jgi:hypothetical protein
MRKAALLFATGSALLLASCDMASEPATKAAARKKGVSKDAPPAPVDEDAPGTPMAERVAVIGLLNKRDGETRDFELKPGEAVRSGKVVIRVRACERTAPWETYPDQGAFVQLLIRERPRGTNGAERWGQVFSGWLFKENVAANIVQHPVYDVWIKECRMRFPGEEPDPAELQKAPAEDDGEASAAPAPKKPSSRPQTPSRAAPAPEPEEEVDEESGGEAEGEATIET